MGSAWTGVASSARWWSVHQKACQHSLSWVFSHIHPGSESNVHPVWQGVPRAKDHGQNYSPRGSEYRRKHYPKPNDRVHLHKAKAKQWFPCMGPDSPQASPRYGRCHIPESASRLPWVSCSAAWDAGDTVFKANKLKSPGLSIQAQMQI